MGGTWTIRSLSAIAIVAFLAGLSQVAQPADLPPARVVDAIIDTELLSASGVLSASDLAGAVTTPQGERRSVPLHELGRPTSTSVPPEPVPTARDRGEKALASYSYDWQAGLPGWEISFHPGRQGVLGYTFVREQRIEVYVRNDMSDALLAHVIAHELGHAVDVSLNSGDDRRRWQEQRGITEQPWWPGNGATDFSTGAGDFAESFASWQVGDGSFRSTIGDPPSQSDNALLAQLAAG